MKSWNPPRPSSSRRRGSISQPIPSLRRNGAEWEEPGFKPFCDSLQNGKFTYEPLSGTQYLAKPVMTQPILYAFARAYPQLMMGTLPIALDRQDKNCTCAKKFLCLFFSDQHEWSIRNAGDRISIPSQSQEDLPDVYLRLL